MRAASLRRRSHDCDDTTSDDISALRLSNYSRSEDNNDEDDSLSSRGRPGSLPRMTVNNITTIVTKIGSLAIGLLCLALATSAVISTNVRGGGSASMISSNDYALVNPTTGKATAGEDQVGDMRRKLQTARTPTAPPTTRKPKSSPTRKPRKLPTTRKPTTKKPTSKPRSSPTRKPTPSPTSKPTTKKPTSKPTASPSDIPTRTPTNLPTSKPSSSRPTTRQPTETPTNTPTEAPTTLKPTEVPTKTPTKSPVPPNDDSVLQCPPPGETMIVITPGEKQIAPAPLDIFCGIFIRKESETGNLIPLVRSYSGKGWEAAPGPLACPTKHVNASTIFLPPLQDTNDRYVILAKDGYMSERKLVSKFLEMTTFGPRRAEIDALTADGDWMTDGASKRASYIQSQIDLPITSHREYWRRRTNSKVDATSQTARSDHPCSPNSKWRKYSYTPQDRLNAHDDNMYIVTTFEVVKAEANFTTTIYEADNVNQVKNGTYNFHGRFSSSSSGYSGTGYYDMGKVGDSVEFTVNASAGIYPISFRFAQGSLSDNGNKKLQLSCNGVIVKSSYDFYHTGGWSYWKYSDMVNVNLIAGANTIKLLSEQNEGPNIDHLRVGKPPAVVMKTNGWPRAIARNGVHLMDEWNVQLTNVTFADTPHPPMSQARPTKLRVYLPDGRVRNLDIGNPVVNFTGYMQYVSQNHFIFDGSEIWDETASDLNLYLMLRGQELLLRNGFNGAICDMIPPFAEEYDAPVFGVLPSGEWLQWTPTIMLEDNGPSINDPSSNMSSKVLRDGGGEAVVATDGVVKCSNVQRSFMNEDTCFLSTLSTACSTSNPVGEVTMPINTTVILDLYTLTGREIYAVQGLVMESISESPCAKTKSRWVVKRGATCPLPSVLTTTTINALTAAITASTDKNEFVTDIDRKVVCDVNDWNQSSDPINIQLQVGPDCFYHVHPDHLNVYDFSGWVTNHPGGPYHIQKWAQGWDGNPGWYLNYPFYGNVTRKIPQHPMNRWVTKAKEPDIVKVGRLGDIIAYRDLPSELKTDDVAEYFGATPTIRTDGGVVVCGSLGEVSNDPTLSEIFDAQITTVGTSDDENLRNQKKAVWTEVALNSVDQLRQRMAWALAQIVTTVPVNIDAYEMTEVYLKYYDTFVKHAFGNYRDILAETSYSPLMAEHLSYLRSKSHSYVYETSNKMIARADENFAREVMQLFTIGLTVLNDEGTPMLDPSTGEPLQTYTNEDIESLARAWTGFDRVPVRGNYEEEWTGSSDNRIDPMLIVPDWRDPFPKSNLNGGFIGDGYKLCSSSVQSFLKKGASFRLLGGKSTSELMRDPSFFTSTTMSGEILRAVLTPSSQLYQKLYNGGDYKLSVTLENDLVCTPGTLECQVDTLRIVKVGLVYYEFVEMPCVQLSFYNNGKQIQLYDSWRRGQMCANPALAQAQEACCREDRKDEVDKAVKVGNVTYLYEGERMTFDKARDRCVAYGRNLCNYDYVENQPFNNSGAATARRRSSGYHWTNKDCGVNVKINSDGYIAIVHDASSSYTDTVPWLVEEKNTLNWFRVFWDGDGKYPGSSETNTCEANKCKTVVSNDGSSSCVCKTIVTDDVVFTSTNNVSKTNVLSQLFIGAVSPQAGSVPTNLAGGLTVHVVGGIIDRETVFEVQDKGRTLFLKNTRSAVTLEGWTMTPQIYEAEDATINNAVVKSNYTTGAPNLSPTGKKYVDTKSGNETTFLEWSVNVPNEGEYMISLRYAHHQSPRPLDVYVNGQLVTHQRANPNSLATFVNVASDPTPAQLPLARCAGDCDSDTHCMPGLFCMQLDNGEHVPGCTGTRSSTSYDYCVDINDFEYGFTLLPTGGWDDDWHMSKPLTVNLNAGQNTIRVKLPAKYKEGPNIDHLMVEGLPDSSSPASFRNPPHFMTLIPDYGSTRVGERTLRDAQYETDAVLDHYFYQDNVAPFLCVRVMQRFSFSNPSPRFVSDCVSAFRTGMYTTGGATFGSGTYGSLEAMVASILLHSEATDGAIAVDPSYGSMREPILKVMNLMRSMDYRTAIPTPIDNSTMQTAHHTKLWHIEERIGQGPYDFPTVFSFFLPNYIPDAGPILQARLASPESVVVTMPNIISMLNGMFSLIKYGLSDCKIGFAKYIGYGDCLDNGSYGRSYGHLFYEPTGVNDFERAGDLAELLTAGRLSSTNLNKIVAACSTEPDQGSKNRCMQQLIVTTGEFHSTNTISQSGEDRAIPIPPSASAESYKAIVYFSLAGGLDSYHMLTPHTCADGTYERYRIIRGKTDISEGIGLPLNRLLEIPANNANQTCSSYGINHNLTALKSLYDQKELTFIANAGLLGKPVTSADYYHQEGLFAHDFMTRETAQVDLKELYAGTGVGGRIAEVLTKAGISTNLFSIAGQQALLTGESGSSSQIILDIGGLSNFNENPSISNMNDVIKSLNNGNTVDSGFNAETWSSKLTVAMDTHKSLKEQVDNTTVTTIFPVSGIASELKLVTRLMQTRAARRSKRDIFYVQDGGYDTHDSVDEALIENFGRINAAIDAFVKELKVLNLWESTVVVQFSEFARTLNPNTGDGSDHAWGGNHFMFGGAIKNGGKVLGQYPSDFNEGAMALSRGRMIPSTPWDAMWYGTAEWFGIPSSSMSKVLPMHKNFPSSKLYDKAELFDAPLFA